MLTGVIDWSLRNRFLVLVFTLLLAIWGLISLRGIALDALPDLSDVQVIIRTSYPGQSPSIIEQQVTYPITTTMMSVPGARVVRGYSYFGDSYVYVLFEDGTDPYWARSRVLEYLDQAGADLPAGVQPRLGPDATGVGWVYAYVLVDHSGQQDLASLRSLQDWYLRYELQTVPGVAEVATVGGMVRQYQIVTRPERLRASGISLPQLIAAVRDSNDATGGSVIELAEAEYMIHTRGYLKSLRDIEQIVVAADANGVPIRLGDLATVQEGPAMRRGLADLDGEGEVTGGIVVMRYGENALQVIDAVKQRLASLRAGLPPGVEIVETYDRSSLINRAVATLSNRLLEEFVVVALVCLLFLFHLRSSLIAIITLPLGILMAFVVMRWQGVTADIMSLGGIAIAIGAMVDASIVMLENAHRHLERWQAAHPGSIPDAKVRWEQARTASVEVGPALFYSLLIITLSFLPVFSLEAQEGRLFSPLAFTKTYAMAAAAGLSVTLIPVLMGYLLTGRIPREKDNPLNRFLQAGYRPGLRWVLQRPWKTLLIALLLTLSIEIPLAGVSGWLAPLKWPVQILQPVLGPAPADSLRSRWPQTVSAWQVQLREAWHQRFAGWPVIDRLAAGLGQEFMPRFDEGDLLYMPTTLPGLSIGKAQQLLQQTDRLIASVPEVARVFGKIGRAETATDPAPLTMIETQIHLRPRAEWRPGMTLEKLIAELDRTVNLPGLTNAWLMPIKTRIDMLATGIKTPVGVKISGPEMAVIEQLGRQVEQELRALPATRSAYAERVAHGRYIEIVPDRQKLAMHGVRMADLNTVIRAAVGGIDITRLVDGTARYPVNLRFMREVRDNVDELYDLPVTTVQGHFIPLKELARVSIVDGPPLIKTENARPVGWIFVDTAGVDPQGFIRMAQRAIDAQVHLPPGYSLTWAGEYEYMQRVRQRLLLVVPLTLIIIFVLLYLIFRRTGEALVVMLTLPFALVGGLWFMFFLGYHQSVASIIGLIALAGVAAEFGVVMLLYLNRAVDERRKAGRFNNRSDLDAAIEEGAVLRVRPKAMTVAVILAGLLPIMLGGGTGSEVMQRIAAPMVGGMLTAPLLSLFVLPAIYRLWLARRLPKDG